MTAAKSPSHSNNHSSRHQIKSNDQILSMMFADQLNMLTVMALNKQTKNSTYISKIDF